MKRLLLSLAMTVILVLALTFTVSAEETSVHDGRVDLDARVTLNDGTEVDLFDSDGNALIYYLDSDGKLQSIRADDSRVKYQAANWSVNIGNNTVGKVGGTEVLSVKIVLDENTTYSSGNIVVFNIMDDDVVTNAGSESYQNMPVTCMKQVFSGAKKLEYVYLRLDTIAIQNSCYSDCPNLKYINIEELTELRRIGDSNNFNGCTSLFVNKVVDLTKTKLYTIDWNSVFKGVPFAGIKFPSTLTYLANGCFENSSMVSYAFPTTIAAMPNDLFKNSSALTTVYLNNTLTSIKDNAFIGCSALNTVFFVGTEEELNALLDNTSTNGNDAFWAVVGENRENIISWADYQKLSDKSGKYVVFGYSYCDAYNDGVHKISQAISPCAGLCEVCNHAISSHADDTNLSVSIVYTDYTKAGEKITLCNNEGCTHSVTEEVKAIFVYRGYSCTEKAINGYHSMTQSYSVNSDALEAYKKINPEFKFGLVASGCENPLDEGVDASKVVNYPNEKFAREYFEIKVKGISDDNMAKAVVFCLYVIDNGTYYVDNNTTSENVTGISFNDLHAIKYPQ